MIYQQAAAGLDTQAALDLARGMGVLSESDYVVATSIQTLREEFDTNNNSMIEASENAGDYASQVNAITKAAKNLQAKNLPITFENMTTELQQMAQTEASTEIEDVGTAAGDAAPGMEDVAGAAGDAAAALGDTAPAAEDTAAGLEGVNSEAPGAASGISSAGNAARTATTPLNTAAVAADRLADALGSIPGRTNIAVSVSGVDSAIAELDRLLGVINQVPSQLNINVNLQGGGGTEMLYPPYKKSDVVLPQFNPITYTPESPTETYSGGETPIMISETYNVYDPLAAAILASNKRMETQRRLEAVMNG